MIHTAEITKQFTLSSISNVMVAFKFSQSDIDKFLRKASNSKSNQKIYTFPKSIDLFYSHPNCGITSVKVLFIKSALGITFILKLRLDIQKLYSDDYSKNITLYSISRHPAWVKVMNQLLNLGFRKKIREITSNNFDILISRFQLDDLNSWKCSRIDFSINLDLDTDYRIFKGEDVEDTINQPAPRFKSYLFLSEQEKLIGRNPATIIFDRLTKSTLMPSRKDIKRIDSIKNFDQSTAAGNSCSKVICYKKLEEITAHNFSNKHDEQQQKYEQSAINIIRFEVQCRYRKIQQLIKKWNITNPTIFDFMDRDKIYDILLEQFKEVVGVENFCSLYYYKTTIEKSTLTPTKQKNLINFVKLISQARSISKAKEDFTKRDKDNRLVGTPLKKSRTIVKGSKSTFYRNLQLLSSLNLSRYPIPRDWGVNKFRNPIYQLYNIFAIKN